MEGCLPLTTCQLDSKLHVFQSLQEQVQVQVQVQLNGVFLNGLPNGIVSKNIYKK